MIVLGLLITLFNFCFSLWQDKKLVSPIVIHSGIWMLMYFLQLFRKDIIHTSWYYLIFAIGNSLFVFGYLLYMRLSESHINVDYHVQNEGSYLFKKKYFNLFMIVVVILFSVYLIDIGNIIKYNFNFNAWQSLRMAKNSGLYQESVLVLYGRNFIIAFTIFIFSVYLENKDYISNIVLTVLVVISLILSFTSGNRGTIFLFLIGMIFTYILKRNLSNKKIIMILFLLVTFILLIFILTTFMKFVYEEQSDKVNFLLPKFRLYFTSSLPAFVEWISEGVDLQYGKNTFNFFLKVLNGLGANIMLPDILQNFRYIGNDYTNVYTIYQFYTQDFGVFYALIVQFFLGMFYSHLYIKNVYKKSENLNSLLFLATMYFPLIYQFFADQFFALTSTWLQFYFWYWLFNKAFIKKYIGEKVNER